MQWSLATWLVAAGEIVGAQGMLRGSDYYSCPLVCRKLQFCHFACQLQSVWHARDTRSRTQARAHGVAGPCAHGKAPGISVGVHGRCALHRRAANDWQRRTWEIFRCFHVSMLVSGRGFGGASIVYGCDLWMRFVDAICGCDVWMRFECDEII